MRTVLLVAGLLLPLVASPQEIYRWVDKDGVVHYADQPGAPNAERIDVTSFERETDEPQDSREFLYQREDEPEPEGPPYGSLTLASPTLDEVFFGTDVTVNVQVEADAELRPGDELLVFVDGARVPNVSGMGATLSNLPRGTHFVRAAIIDSAGEVLITSEQVTFHVRQQSIATPPTGPRPTPLPSRGG